MNEIKVHIIQEQEIPVMDKQISIIRSARTENEKSEEVIRVYALYLFDAFYEQQVKSKGEIKPFDRRKEIVFNVSWNNIYHKTYYLKRIKEYKTRRQGESPVLIRGTLYVLRSETEIKRKVIAKNEQSHNKVEKYLPADMSLIFNTIEHLAKGISKFPTPVLLTGWTQ